MSKYQIVVGNVGTVYSGNNKRQASKHFSESVKNAKVELCSWFGEPVTMLENGEPVREYAPKEKTAWYVEFTDTYGGEANYSWVKRFKVVCETERGAIMKAKREVFNPGSRHDTDMDTGDMKRIKMRGMNICAFIQLWYEPYHCNMFQIVEI